MEIGKMLEMERRKKGISRVSLAQEICSQQMIYKLETGESTVSTFMLEVLNELGNVRIIWNILFPMLISTNKHYKREK